MKNTKYRQTLQGKKKKKITSQKKKKRKTETQGTCLAVKWTENTGRIELV